MVSMYNYVSLKETNRMFHNNIKIKLNGEKVTIEKKKKTRFSHCTEDLFKGPLGFLFSLKLKSASFILYVFFCQPPKFLSCIDFN